MIAESVRRPSPDRWEWIAAGVVLLFSTGAFLPVLQEEGGRASGAGGNVTTIALWSFFYLLAFLQIAREGRVRLSRVRWDVGVLCVVGLAILSTSWSLDPALTLRRSVALAGTALIGVWLGLRFTTRRLITLLAVVLGLVAIVSLVLGFTVDGIDPNHLEARAWRGAFESKNLMAQVTVLGLIVFFVGGAGEAGKRTVPYWGGLGGLVLSAGLVAMTASATGLIMAVLLLPLVGVLFLAKVNARRTLQFILGLTFVVLLGVLMLSSGLVILDTADVFSVVGRTETLTGRTQIWRLVAERIAERPILGFGHGAFWTGLDGAGSGALARRFGQDPGYAHNGFLDVLLSVGVVGLGCYLLSFAGSFGLALRRLGQRSSRRGMWPILFLMFLIMGNLTEGGLVQQNHYMLILYIAVALRLRL